jgi:hypothetical protein
MADQRIFDFEGNLADGKLRVERAIEAALSLSRKIDPDSEAAAAAAFEELEQMAVRSADPKTQMRVFGASGDFHNGRGDCRIAEAKYETAMGSAKLLEVTSDDGVDSVQLLRFKLNKVRNTHDQAFGNLEKSAQLSDSYEQRNRAWASYQRDQANSVGRLAARGLGSKEYFRGLLDDAKLAPSDDEEEDIRW